MFDKTFPTNDRPAVSGRGAARGGIFSETFVPPSLLTRPRNDTTSTLPTTLSQPASPTCPFFLRGIDPLRARLTADLLCEIPADISFGDFDLSERASITTQLYVAAAQPPQPPYRPFSCGELLELALKQHRLDICSEPPAPPVPAKLAYAAHFHPDGSPAMHLVANDFGKRVLPHSRGIFLRHLPPGVTLEAITAHIRGGALERVDWHSAAPRPFVGAYFLLPSSAAHFIRSVRGSRFWGAVTVEAITHAKGGHEVMKPNVARAVRDEGATRVLTVEGLPGWVDEAWVRGVVEAQSRGLRAEIEGLRWSWVAGKGWSVTVTMASVGTALGVRLMLRRRVGEVGELGYRWERDPCEGRVEELGVVGVGAREDLDS